MTIKIGLVAFKDVEELDLIGPWEVFQSAALIDADIECEIISLDGKGIDAAKGLHFDVHGSMQAAMETESSYDILLLPGGKGVFPLMEDKAFLKCLMAMTKNATWVTSVCTGSLVYAHMGLLDGRDCITHHARINDLRKLLNGGRIIEGGRYVRDGNYVTAAGISAGIDMSLWLLGEIKNPEFARQVQLYMEYFPDPPYSDLTRG